MPTVHLSLPEAVYSELKEYASEMGIQITDLIKMMIKEGLEKYRRERAERKRRQQEEVTQALLQVLHELEELRREFQEYRAYVEGELYRLNSSIHGLKRRVSKLEDMVEERLIPVEAEIVSP